MGVVIAIGPIISSFTIRHFLLLPSEIAFRKIGYKAMAISGMVQLINTASTIMKLDNTSIHVKPFSLKIGTQLAFRKTHIATEVEYDEGIHIAHQITMDEIPEGLHPRIELLTLRIKCYLEDVHGFGTHYYEVYITKKGVIELFDEISED
jgi:hypothetical protein